MSRRFLWLDGSRGLAAVIVMIYHFAAYLQTGGLFKSSYLAVDLFFMMSGFVLAHAYGAKLRGGMTFGRFLAIRMIRLYPMYAIATAVGLGYYVAKIVLGQDDAPSALDLFDITTLNAFFIPNHDGGTTPGGMFPFAPTSWSLSAELIVSVLYATILYRMRRSTCAVVMAVAAVCFAVFALHYRTVDLGWDARTFAPSLFRATAEFTAGLLMYGSFPHHASRPAGWSAPATFALLVGTMVFLPSSAMLSLAAIALLFPMIIHHQALSEPTGRVAWLCHQLGRGSYPIYLLHTPVLLWGVGLAKMVAPGHHFGPALGLALIAATLVASYLCVALIEEPVRRLLSALIGRRFPVDRVNYAPTSATL